MARLAVPMCGENAESIEAPPSMRAASDASLDPAPCGSTDEAIQRGVPGDRPVERVVPEGPPRMLPLVHPLPASPKYERVERRDVLDQARPGFVESLYRPPR